MPTDNSIRVCIRVCLRIIVYGNVYGYGIRVCIRYCIRQCLRHCIRQCIRHCIRQCIRYILIIIIFSSSLYSSKLEKIEIISYHIATSIQTTNNYYKYFRNATTTTIRQWNALFASTLSTLLTTALLLIADIHFIVSVL
jgi:hypothetical protein